MSRVELHGGPYRYYIGPTDQGDPYGYGKLFTDKLAYEGDVHRSGYQHGMGTRYVEGARLIGRFKFGTFIDGKKVFDNGKVQEGLFNNKAQIVEGVSYQDAKKFEGTYVDGEEAEGVWIVQ